MNWRSFVRDYLVFTKKERLAVALFCGAILILYAWPLFYRTPKPEPIHEDTALSRLLDSAKQIAESNLPLENSPEEPQYSIAKPTAAPAGELFFFDPNTLEAEGWQRLGLRPRTVQTLLKYRSKGGHFYKPEDVQKIWGLPTGFYDRVKDYIRIETTMKPRNDDNFFKIPYAKPVRSYTAVDVNTADTSALIALPGIGSKLAQRILNFRDRLGGFYSAAQVGETYGLPDSTFQKLKPYLQVHGDLKKLHLNTASKDELKTHPYIKWNLANAIVEYRNQHGTFKKLEELKNILLVDEALYTKLLPYFTLD